MAKAVTWTPPAAELGQLMGTRRLPRGARLVHLDPAPDHRERDVAWVWAFGRLRRGMVTNVARVNVTVAWVSPSNPTQVRKTKMPAAVVYPDRRAAESGAA